jgi:hypothetical protein
MKNNKVYTIFAINFIYLHFLGYIVAGIFAAIEIILTWFKHEMDNIDR